MVLNLILLIFSLFITFFNINQPLLEAHGFRQTQTALTSYYFLQEGWQLDYQTPVAGYPWSIPFEFPIYQSIVALITFVTGIKLDVTGRLVSYFFLIACVWPIKKIVFQLRLDKKVFWIFCGLFFSSPLYLFWGRAFMIETTALFFTLAAIPYGIDLLESRIKLESVFFFSFWMTLGFLQKITTSVPAFLIIAILIIISNFKYLLKKTKNLKKLVIIYSSFVPPLLFGGSWYLYSDFVKSKNLLGKQLVSSSLLDWNFGTLEQRLDLNILKTLFWERIIQNNAGGIIGIIIIILIFFFAQKRIKNIIFVSLALFIFPILIFYNLHIIHDYYQTSSVVFLIFSLSVSINYLFINFSKKRFSFYVIIILVILSLFRFTTGYGLIVRMKIDEKNNQVLALSDVIREYTDKNSGIVVFGADWSSEISYYSERKSFTVPAWFTKYNEVWHDPAAFLGEKKLGAVIYCGMDFEEKPDILANNRENINQAETTLIISNCLIWIQ